MEPATVSLRERHHDVLAELSQDDGPCKNRSDAMRKIIDRYNEIPELQERIDELETENERLNRERRQLLEQRDENDELIDFAGETKSVLERREARKEAIRTAPVWRRALWWLVGEPE